MKACDIKTVSALIANLESLSEGLDRLRNEKLPVFPAHNEPSPLGFRGFRLVNFNPAIKTLAIADYEAAIEATRQKLRALGVSLGEGSAE